MGVILSVGRLSAALLVSAVLFAGCSHARHQTRHGTASPLAWRDAMNDWFDNGRFDRPHPCAAVREAARKIPIRLRAKSLPAFRRYEARVCH
jgi:hypothetical protein